MKKLLFWVLLIPMGAIVLVTDFGWWVCRKYLAAHEVLYVAFSRFEYWAMDVPRGTHVNCPWKQSLKEVWKENQ